MRKLLVVAIVGIGLLSGCYANIEHVATGTLDGERYLIKVQENAADITISINDEIVFQDRVLPSTADDRCNGIFDEECNLNGSYKGKPVEIKRVTKTGGWSQARYYDVYIGDDLLQRVVATNPI